MDGAALGALGGSLGRPITGVVHGAGLEDSKLVDDKDYDVFDRVVRVKVDGWRALLGAVQASGREHPEFQASHQRCRIGIADKPIMPLQLGIGCRDARRIPPCPNGCVAIGWTCWRDVYNTRLTEVFAAAGIETLAVEDE